LAVFGIFGHFWSFFGRKWHLQHIVIMSIGRTPIQRMKTAFFSYEIIGKTAFLSILHRKTAFFHIKTAFFRIKS
jgi:hypothetical protein